MVRLLSFERTNYVSFSFGRIDSGGLECACVDRMCVAYGRAAADAYGHHQAHRRTAAYADAVQ